MIANAINTGTRSIPPWVLYVLGTAYGGWLFFLALTGGLGVEPIEALEHLYGEFALQLIVLGLAVTPLRTYFKINLMKHRRAIGVLTFAFVLAHFMVWAVLDVGSIGAMWADILERPYVTIGTAGFLLLIPLGLSSNNWSVRRMGAAAWRKMHKLVYPAALLGAIHYLWLARGFQIEPILYTLAIVGLLVLRLPAVKARLAR